MNRTVFLAGATGAIGLRLIPLLLAAGWTVVGGTRTPAKASLLERMGVTPAVGDAFDAVRMEAIITQYRPSHVMHQLTDLPDGLDPAKMADARLRNARLREIGTRNLVSAALRHGVRRFIAQSIAFAFAPGPQPFTEESPLDINATAVCSLEEQVLVAPLAGVVLRYGHLYGPGTGFDRATQAGAVHVDAAAFAALLAADRGAPGLYNIAEDDGAVSSHKAEVELGWRPSFRLAG